MNDGPIHAAAAEFFKTSQEILVLKALCRNYGTLKKSRFFCTKHCEKLPCYRKLLKNYGLMAANHITLAIEHSSRSQTCQPRSPVLPDRRGRISGNLRWTTIGRKTTIQY